MPLPKFYNLSKPSNTGFHNLCTTTPPPPGTADLLWNGLKFCLQHALPKPKLDTTITRLTQDIRRQAYWKTHEGELNESYNPKLYIKSHWEPPKAAPALETALTKLHQHLHSQVQTNQQSQRRQHNLYASNRLLIQTLKASQDHIVLPTDKNLGPAILERSVYKLRCLQDHLLDTTTYKRLEPWEADCQMYRATKAFEHLIKTHEKSLPDAETTYFKRCFEETRRLPQFYCTPKVHKKPKWKTRPIVSCVNSRMGDLSKWVDVQLQKLIHLCPGYLQDSQAYLTKLRRLGRLPTTAVILTADAVSMYTNINTTHALATLQKWLTLHQDDLPHDYPTQMVLEATALVMKNNVFQFDDTYWLQLTGTAMGSNLAVAYATIYYAYHEETTILPNLQHCLLLYGRLIDDAGMIIDSALLPQGVSTGNLSEFLTDLLQFGDLHWEVDPPSNTINFLDLTVTIEGDGTITTSTFIKPMNLHLYIPPRSAHPPGVLKSLIYGNLQRFWKQNTRQEDYTANTASFFTHLLNRGYDTEMLTPIFEEAARKLDSPTQHKTKQRASSNTTFLHWEYHPKGIPRQAIRAAFTTILSPALAQAGLQADPTIAYSVPRSLGNCITKTQLREPPGQRVSTLIEQLDHSTSQPLAPP